MMARQPRARVGGLHALVVIIALVAPQRVAAQAPPDDSPPSAADALLRPLGRDLAGMVSGDQWIIAVVGGGLAAIGSGRDRVVAESSFLEDSARLNDFGAVFGSFPVLAGEALLTYGVGRAIDSPRVASVGAELFRSQVIAQGVTQAIKVAVGRRRPDGSDNRSFPSGHSSAVFSAATVLAIDSGWKAGVPAYSVATMVALTRIGKNKHYVADVVAGATIGVLAGRAVTFTTARQRVRISPMFLPRGAGVIVRIGPKDRPSSN